jgi:hypothetical protein
LEGFNYGPGNGVGCGSQALDEPLLGLDLQSQGKFGKFRIFEAFESNCYESESVGGY